MLLQIEFFVLTAMLVVMVAAWAFGLARKNGGWTDVFWTWGSGVTLTAAALWPLEGSTAWRQWLVAGMLIVWTLRLGLYLTPRVAGHPEDARYAAFRDQFGSRYPINMLWVTLPQAPATALLGITVVLAAHRPDDGPAYMQIGTAAWGLIVFVVAIVGEAIADGQMKRFRADPANKGQVMDRGLWAWSRHPNYFFQWLSWIAFWIQSWDPWRPFWLILLSFAAPAVMFGLLRYVSGVPPLEEAMLKSRGDLFRDYQKRVSVFFPLPRRAR